MIQASSKQDLQTPEDELRGFSFALERQAAGDSTQLSLRALHRIGFGAIGADWSQAEIRRRVAAGRRQPLARAVGLHKVTDDEICVLDATAGLGRDGYTLAALGARVTMAERNPTVVQLLCDAWRRIQLDPVLAHHAARIELIEADAAGLLTGARRWDVIYLDPMYPDDGKSALPSKEMQILRDLTGGDADADRLLTPALNCAKRRVVVKRPLKAPWLAGRAPSMSLRSTQLRFDVYLLNPSATTGTQV